MTDEEALSFLAGKLGSRAKVATALGVSDQQLHNWCGKKGRNRGISATMRPAVWAMVNDHGGNLSRDWLLDRARAA